MEILLVSQIGLALSLIALGYFIGVYVEKGRTPDHINETHQNIKQYKD